MELLTSRITTLLLFLFFPVCFFASVTEADSSCTATQLPMSLPVDLRALSTCNAPDQYQSLNCGNSEYLKGREHVYRFSLSASQRVDLFLINLKDVYTNSTPQEALSLFVLDDCPNNNGQCIAFTEGQHSLKLSRVRLHVRKSYYILISSREKCVDYSLLIKPSADYPIDNIVPDPGFDHIGPDPCGYQQLGSDLASYSPFWSTPNQASTDLWSLLTGAPVCLTNPRTTHNLRMGQQEPLSSHAFAGMMVQPGPTSLYREYIQTQLTHPLIPGQMYEVSWHVSLGEASGLTAKGWGACFSTQKIDSSGYSLIGLQPDIQSQVLVRDTLSWVRISGTFTASQASQYMSIGFFLPQTQTSWYLTGHGNQQKAYYFVDDVVLRPIFPLILPVTEVHLAASRMPSGHVQLDWNSWNEQQLNSYEIERSGPDGHFATLDQPVSARGAPQEMEGYRYEDRSAFGMSELHYRLRIVDQDGSFAYSDVVSVFQPLDESFGQIGPNPFRHEMMVSWQHFREGNIDVRILNTSGQLVKNMFFRRARGLQQLLISDLSALPMGVYIVHVQDGDHQETFRLLKR